ncbi:hypothetical protein IWX47DRAFT_527842 [Phyllosticta citricarpa]
MYLPLTNLSRPQPGLPEKLDEHRRPHPLVSPTQAPSTPYCPLLLSPPTAHGSPSTDPSIHPLARLPAPPARFHPPIRPANTAHACPERKGEAGKERGSVVRVWRKREARWVPTGLTGWMRLDCFSGEQSYDGFLLLSGLPLPLVADSAQSVCRGCSSSERMQVSINPSCHHSACSQGRRPKPAFCIPTIRSNSVALRSRGWRRPKCAVPVRADAALDWLEAGHRDDGSLREQSAWPTRTQQRQAQIASRFAVRHMAADLILHRPMKGRLVSSLLEEKLPLDGSRRQVRLSIGFRWSGC